MSPTAATAAGLVGEHPLARARRSRRRRCRPAASPARNAASPLSSGSEVYSPVARQAALAEHAGLDVGAAQLDVDLLLDVVGRAFLDHQHGALAGAERAHLLRHQRIDDVEHVDRNARGAVEIGEVEPLERAQHAVGEAADHDDADVVEVAGDQLVELVLADECCAAGRRSSTLQPLLREDDRRMRELAIVEARRTGDAVLARIGGAPVVLGGELAGDVAGADAQLHHHRRVARLRQLEALLDHAHDGRQVGARIEQPHRGFHRVGIGALLDHARALAVVLAEDDHHAADHAGRGEVRQRVGRHVGADDRLPGHRAAQRIVDRGAQHRGRRGLVGAGLQMHAEVADDVLGIDQHVEQVRDRRALIAADIAHARLQQRLGHREDALAAEGLAVAELERLHFFLERAFHPPDPSREPATSITAPEHECYRADLLASCRRWLCAGANMPPYRIPGPASAARCERA